MTNEEFKNLIEEVQLLIAETHNQEDLDLTLLEFHRMWETNKNNISFPPNMEMNPTTFTCYYHHYLMLRLLQKTAIEMRDKKVAGSHRSNTRPSYLKLVH